MRKILALITAAAVMGLAATASADTTATATKRVAVNVAQSVGVGSAGTVAVPDVQTGRIPLTIPFRVDANTQYVDMLICATALFKADIPTSPYTIPLSDAIAGVPVLFAPDNNFTGPTGNVSQNMPLTGTATTAVISGNTWNFACSAAVRFHSPDNGSFSKNVNVTVSWNNTNFELPVGEYSGYVRLTVFTVPPGA